MAAEDVEIVYVGEASQEGSYRPPLEPGALRSEPEVIKLTNRPAASSNSAEKKLTPIPIVPAGNSLQVTTSAGPNVAQATKKRAAKVAPVSPVKAVAVKAQPKKVRVEAAVASTPPASAATPREDYARSLSALRNKNHAFAIVGFENFLSRYPNHDYADNALYWLGEAYYDQRKYSAARKHFERVYSEYPGGNKVPSALLKAAYCHLQLGATDSAREVFDRIIALYPKTGPARLAQQRLSEIK
jgi:tol-pal system protein YbgF